MKPTNRRVFFRQLLASLVVSAVLPPELLFAGGASARSYELDAAPPQGSAFHVGRPGEIRITLQALAPLAPGTELDFHTPPFLPGLFPFAGKTGAPRVDVESRTPQPDVELVTYPLRASASVNDPFFRRYTVRLPQGLPSGGVVRLSLPYHVHWMYYFDTLPLVHCKIVLRQGAEREETSFSWPVAPQPVARRQLLLPSTAVAGEPLTGLVSMTDDMGRLCLDCAARLTLLPSPGLRLRRESLELEPGRKGVLFFEVAFETPGVHRLHARLNDADLVSNPVLVDFSPHIYWGDLHAHTVFSWDQRNWLVGDMQPRDAVAYVREASLLDFIGFADHAEHDLIAESGGLGTPPDVPQYDMLSEDWEIYQEQILNAPDNGVLAFVGLERRDERGDTNQIFLEAGRLPRTEDGEREPVAAIYAGAAPVLGIPHLHNQHGLERYSPRPAERLVEIYSTLHGRYEYKGNPQPEIPHAAVERKVKPWRKDAYVKGPFVRELLDAGLRLGFTAGEDHGMPGQGGKTAVFAPQKSRKDIFQALWDRAAYATTGPRIVLDFFAAGARMGRERRVTRDDAPALARELRVRVNGTAPLRLVEVIRNGDVLHTLRPACADLETVLRDDTPLHEISRPRPLDGGAPSTYYYVRVTQEDGHMAWSSPVFLLPV